jgi:uncharacterized protein YhbP (UPF0306 family)
VSDARGDALEYLANHRVMTLSVTSGGNVWAAAVFYVNLDFFLYFLSAGHTRHARYIADNPWAAAAIQEDYRDWREIKGIQLEGPVNLLSGAQRIEAIAHYRAKYPFIVTAVGAVAAALEKVNWYRLAPTRLYYIDNGKGFGHREEVPL